MVEIETLVGRCAKVWNRLVEMRGDAMEDAFALVDLGAWVPSLP